MRAFIAYLLAAHYAGVTCLPLGVYVAISHLTRLLGTGPLTTSTTRVGFVAYWFVGERTKLNAVSVTKRDPISKPSYESPSPKILTSSIFESSSLLSLRNAPFPYRGYFTEPTKRAIFKLEAPAFNMKFETETRRALLCTLFVFGLLVWLYVVVLQVADLVLNLGLMSAPLTHIDVFPFNLRVDETGMVAFVVSALAFFFLQLTPKRGRRQ
jgi:hypothetical protein